MHSHTPPAPLQQLAGDARAEVRARLAEAQKLDSKLIAGYYSGLSTLDFVMDHSDSDAVVDELRSDVAPESWSHPGRDAFRLDSWLVVFQTDEVHQKIGPWIREWVREQQTTKGIIQTEISIHSVSTRDEASLCRLLGIDAVPGGKVVQPRAVDMDELRSLRTFRTMTTPRITTLSGQRASFQLGNETAYIGDYEIYYVNGHKLADPIVETITDGILVELTPTLDAARRNVSVDVEVAMAKLNGMEAVEITVGEDRLHLDLPEVAQQYLETSFTAPRGQTMAVVSRGLEDDELLVVTIRAE